MDCVAVDLLEREVNLFFDDQSKIWWEFKSISKAVLDEVMILIQLFTYLNNPFVSPSGHF